ncbi:hypothetical protein HK098_001285 [Nowakowskiella sp. JEL0407]|nr:hypothetical protein HK098_001285 [Nowakowskiella sp. JEL0407]
MITADAFIPTSAIAGNVESLTGTYEENLKASVIQSSTQIIPGILIHDSEPDSDFNFFSSYTTNVYPTIFSQDLNHTLNQKVIQTPEEYTGIGWQTPTIPHHQTLQQRAQDIMQDYKWMQEQQQGQKLQFQQYHNSRNLDSQNLSTRPNLVRSLSDRNLQHFNTHHVEPASTTLQNTSFSAIQSSRSQRSPTNSVLQLDDATLISIIKSIFDSKHCIFISDTDLDRHFQLAHEGKTLPWWHFANTFNDFIEQWLIPRTNGELGVAIAIRKTPEGGIDRTRWIFKRGVVGLPSDDDTKLYRIHNLVENGSELKIIELAGLLHVAEDFELLPNTPGFNKYLNCGADGTTLETRIRTRFNASYNEYVESCKSDIKQLHRNCCRIISDKNLMNGEKTDDYTQELVVVRFAKPQKITHRGLPVSLPLTTIPPTRSGSPSAILFNETDNQTLSTSSIFSGRGTRAVSLSALNSPAIMSSLELNDHPMRRRSDTDLSNHGQNSFEDVKASNQGLLPRSHFPTHQRAQSGPGFVPHHNRTKSFPSIAESGLSFFSHSAAQQQPTAFQLHQQIIEQQNQIQQLQHIQQLQQSMYNSSAGIAGAEFYTQTHKMLSTPTDIQAYNLSLENQLTDIEKQQELLATQMFQLSVGEE